MRSLFTLYFLFPVRVKLTFAVITSLWICGANFCFIVFSLHYLAVQVYTFVGYSKSFGKCIKRINIYIYIIPYRVKHFIILFGKATLASVSHA